MNKKTLVKILIPVLIVIAIGAIWLYKNADTLVPKGTVASTTAGQTNTAGGTVTAKETVPANDDLLLETDKIDLEKLTSYGLPIIFDFGSESCDPCRRMKPDLIAVNEAMQGKAIIKYIDVWKHTDAATGYPISLIPTQMIINADGTPYVPGEGIGLEFTNYNNRTTGEHALTLHQGMLTQEEMLLILEDMGVVR
ncbi:MAG: thioredoxin family protein [Clostridiaceae bacterium]|jgi:thioredoxin 1|nr:thioredoxin family protein [Clostridiaceae bacterium]